MKVEAFSRTDSILLSPDELYVGAMAGVHRRISCIRSGSPDGHYEHNQDAWATDIEGALRELALAKHTGRWWTGLEFKGGGTTKAGDVGELQVRGTDHNSGHLLIYDDDPDTAPFVLVIGVAPRYRIVGQIFGGEGKQQRWWREDGVRYPAFWVPQEVLRDV